MQTMLTSGGGAVAAGVKAAGGEEVLRDLNEFLDLLDRLEATTTDAAEGEAALDEGNDLKDREEEPALDEVNDLKDKDEDPEDAAAEVLQMAAAAAGVRGTPLPQLTEAAAAVPPAQLQRAGRGARSRPPPPRRKKLPPVMEESGSPAETPTAVAAPAALAPIITAAATPAPPGMTRSQRRRHQRAAAAGARWKVQEFLRTLKRARRPPGLPMPEPAPAPPAGAAGAAAAGPPAPATTAPAVAGPTGINSWRRAVVLEEHDGGPVAATGAGSGTRTRSPQQRRHRSSRPHGSHRREPPPWRKKRGSTAGGDDDEPPRVGAMPEVEGDAAMPLPRAQSAEAAAEDRLNGYDFWPDSRDSRIRWVPIESFIKVPAVTKDVRKAPHQWRLQWQKVGVNKSGRSIQRERERGWDRPQTAATGQATRDELPLKPVRSPEAPWGQPDRAALVAAAGLEALDRLRPRALERQGDRARSSRDGFPAAAAGGYQPQLYPACSDGRAAPGHRGSPTAAGGYQPQLYPANSTAAAGNEHVSDPTAAAADARGSSMLSDPAAAGARGSTAVDPTAAAADAHGSSSEAATAGARGSAADAAGACGSSSDPSAAAAGAPGGSSEIDKELRIWHDIMLQGVDKPMEHWLVDTIVRPTMAYYDDEETPYRLRAGRDNVGQHAAEAPDSWPAAHDAAEAGIPEIAEAFDPDLARQVEAEARDLRDDPVPADAGAAAAENKGSDTEGSDTEGVPKPPTPPPIPHGRGPVFIEACSPHACPDSAELERSRVFWYDMRREWRTPDRAAVECMAEGHAGQTGVLLRSIAFHRCWAGVVAAARRACNRAWWEQIRGGALENGFQPLKLTFLCSNGAHRSMAAAVLLTEALKRVEGAAAVKVYMRDCWYCQCPGRCNRHTWCRHELEGHVSWQRATRRTQQLMRADAQLMPRAKLQLPRFL